jgi:hypothetical protein
MNGIPKCKVIFERALSVCPCRLLPCSSGKIKPKALFSYRRFQKKFRLTHFHLRFGFFSHHIFSEEFSMDLREEFFGIKGFSRRNVFCMRKFAEKNIASFDFSERIGFKQGRYLDETIHLDQEYDAAWLSHHLYHLRSDDLCGLYNIYCMELQADNHLHTILAPRIQGKDYSHFS